MLFRLASNSFVRQFGPYTYLFERVKALDKVYKNAEVFFRWITREATDSSVAINQILKVYDSVDRATIENDFLELISGLIKDGIVVAGSTVGELYNKDLKFTYSIERPRTLNFGESFRKDEGAVAIQEDLSAWFKVNPSAFNLQIDLTQACTERCIHCYVPDYTPIFLPVNVVERVIDEFRGQGGLHLSLSGGECMLHPDFKRIISYARANDLVVSILSNLTVCDDCMVQFLKRNDVSVQVSLYSMKPEVHDAITQVSGSFMRTVRAIKQLHVADIPCLISCPTMKQNFNDYLEVLAFARSLKMHAQTDFIIMGKKNCDTSNLTCRLDLAQTRKVIEDIVCRSLPTNNEYFAASRKALSKTPEEWQSENVCGAGSSLICLDAKGEYHPCPSLSGITLGSCYQHNLKWVLSESTETIRIRNVTGKCFPKCAHCKDRDYCSVCMSRNFNETGCLFTPVKHFCDVARLNHEVVDEAQRMRLAGEM